MKNYLSLSNLSEAVTRIVPCKEKKAKSVGKKAPFVVLNSDNNYGFYVRRLAEEIKKLGLEQLPKILRRRSLKDIQTCDVIVFGDMRGNINYDYRVETDPKSLDNLDGRKFKVYDLVVDFDKVIKRLYKYVEENANGYLFIEDEPLTTVTEINIEVNAFKKHPKYVTPIAILRNEIREEKVTIFDNWVKIGYNQYDIYCDLFGKEFIYVNGNKFFIKEDRFGKRYLVQ